MKHACRLAVAVSLGLLALATSARGDQTYAPGTVLGDTAWAPGETITLQGDLDIAGHVTAAPGVTVYAAQGAVVKVASGGTLEAKGTQLALAGFYGEDLGSDPALWGGIRVESGGVLDFDHAIVDHASTGIDILNATALIRHSQIVDIEGVNGAAGGSSGLTGLPGGDGTNVYGIKASGTTRLEVTDTRIEGIYAGSGGHGGGVIDGGPGGAGGAAFGVYIALSGSDPLIFERNAVGFVFGGWGGAGGSIQGRGGNAGPCKGILFVSGPGTAIRNCTLHHIEAGQPGTAGVGPFTGTPGDEATVDAAALTLGSIDFIHCTFDKIGENDASLAMGVNATFVLGGPVHVVNCSFTHLFGATALGLHQGSGAQIVASHCNFFGVNGITGGAAVTESIAVDPLFPADSDGIYDLIETSPLVGAGEPTGTALDINGELRDAAPDIGADEYVPYIGRLVGDFNGDLCTEIGDFLYLLDNWGVDPGDGTPVGISDFLALLDNWRTGRYCA